MAGTTSLMHNQRYKPAPNHQFNAQANNQLNQIYEPAPVHQYNALKADNQSNQRHDPVRNRTNAHQGSDWDRATSSESIAAWGTPPNAPAWPIQAQCNLGGEGLPTLQTNLFATPVTQH